MHMNSYELLNLPKFEVKMVTILDSFFFVYTSISLNRNKSKATTSLVNRKCKTYGKKGCHFYARHSG